MVDLGRNIRFTEGNEFSSNSYPDSSGSLASGWSPRVSQDPGDQPMTNESERKRLKLQSSGPRRPRYVKLKTSFVVNKRSHEFKKNCFLYDQLELV